MAKVMHAHTRLAHAGEPRLNGLGKCRLRQPPPPRRHEHERLRPAAGMYRHVCPQNLSNVWGHRHVTDAGVSLGRSHDNLAIDIRCSAPDLEHRLLTVRVNVFPAKLDQLSEAQTTPSR